MEMVLALSSTDMAAPPPDTPSGAPAAAKASLADIENLQVSDLHLTFLQGVMDWLSKPVDAFMPVVDRMLDTGSSLFWAISLLYFSYLGLKIILESSSVIEQMGNLVNGLLIWGMIKFGLDYYKPLLGIVNEGFNQVGAAMLGLDTVTSITNSVYAGLEAYMKIALIIWSSFPVEFGFSLASLVSVVSTLAQFKVLLADFVLMCLTMLALVACAGLYIAIYIYAMMLFAVGMMLGPIMLPWKLLSPFSYIADGWMKFMVMAGMYRLVALAIIHINELVAMGVANTMLAKQAVTHNFLSGVTPPNLNNFAITLTNIETMPIQHLFLSLAMLVFALITIYMLLKVNEITSSLLSGSGSGGMNFGRGGIPSLGGGGGGSGGAGGGRGGGVVQKLAGAATGGATAAASAAKGALASSATGRAASAAAKGAGQMLSSAANKAVGALPVGGQVALGTAASAGRNAIDRAKQAVGSAGQSLAQRGANTEAGKFATQTAASVRAGSSTPTGTQNAATRGSQKG